MAAAINSESKQEYLAMKMASNVIQDDDVIQQAMTILLGRVNRKGPAVTSVDAFRQYWRLNQHGQSHESFVVAYLDSQHQVINHEELFRGTIDAAAVYPREIAKECLSRGAAAVILLHNHPSGRSEPSQADIKITGRVKDALALLDIKVLDHFIVSDEGYVSLAERGQI